MNGKPLQPGDKITIYTSSGFMGNICRYQATYVSHGAGKYAQYENSQFLHYIPAGKRKPHSIRGTYHPFILVLRGHGHPNPGDFFGEERQSGSFSVKESRHSSFAPEWKWEFNAMINPYIEKNPDLVAFDWRHTKDTCNLIENNERKDLQAVETTVKPETSSSTNMAQTAAAPIAPVTTGPSPQSDEAQLAAAMARLQTEESASAPAEPKRKWVPRKQWIAEQAEKTPERKVAIITLEEVDGELQLRFPGSIEKSVSQTLRPAFEFKPQFWKDPVWVGTATRANLVLAAKIVAIGKGESKISPERVKEIAAIT